MRRVSLTQKRPYSEERKKGRELGSMNEVEGHRKAWRN
jgi:hypothetical protein